MRHSVEEKGVKVREKGLVDREGEMDKGYRGSKGTEVVYLFHPFQV